MIYEKLRAKVLFPLIASFAPPGGFEFLPNYF
jgi:hypothetical protein